MKRVRVLIFACLATLSTAQAASFNCAKASTVIEKTICGNVDLLKLDDELNSYYRKALGELTDEEKTELLEAQHQWISEVRNNCNQNKDQLFCLFEAYRSRNAELQAFYEDARIERMLKELPELSSRSGLSSEEIKKALDDCNTGQAGQYGMNTCAYLYSVHARIAMDSVLAKKLQLLPSSCQEKLRISQKKWNENVGSDCSKQAEDEAGGGTMAPMLENMCLETNIKIRAAKLKSIKSCNSLP